MFLLTICHSRCTGAQRKQLGKWECGVYRLSGCSFLRNTHTGMKKRQLFPEQKGSWRGFRWILPKKISEQWTKVLCFIVWFLLCSGNQKFICKEDFIKRVMPDWIIIFSSWIEWLTKKLNFASSTKEETIEYQLQHYEVQPLRTFVIQIWFPVSCKFWLGWWKLLLIPQIFLGEKKSH